MLFLFYPPAHIKYNYTIDMESEFKLGPLQTAFLSSPSTARTSKGKKILLRDLSCSNEGFSKVLHMRWTEFKEWDEITKIIEASPSDFFTEPK